MIHYTYKLTFKLDERYYYYGKHSTNYESMDKYMGSGATVTKYKKQYGRHCFNKRIIKRFNSTQDALDHERELIGDLWKTDPFCLNNRPGGSASGKMDFTGLKIMHKGNITKHVSPDKVSLFESEGWVAGLRPESISKMVGALKLVRSNPEYRKQVSESIKKLWQTPEYRKNMSEKHKGKQNLKGFRFSEESRKKMSLSHIGHVPATKGKKLSEAARQKIKNNKPKQCWVCKGSDIKFILESDLEKYIRLGYIRGRKGIVWVHKDNVLKCIKEKELESYINKGWVRGRKYKSNR